MSTDKGQLSPAASELDHSLSAVTDGRVELLGGPAVCTVWLTAALMAVLLPAWLAGGVQYQADILTAVVSPWLLVAMALLLGARAGVLNISVWGVASLGSVVTHLVISGGLPVPLALLGALIAGTAVGALTFLLIRWTRLSGAIVTVAVGAGLLAGARYLMRWASPGRVDEQALGLLSEPELQMLLVALLYALALWALTLPRASRRSALRVHPQGRVWTALVAGGALAATAGGFVLLGRLEVFSRAILLGDLRPLAAATLTGAWLWRQREGMLMGAVLLPVAMLVATIWRQLVPPPVSALHASSVAPLMTLIVMVLVLQRIGRSPGRSRLRLAAVMLGWLGVVVTACSVHAPLGGAENALVWCGAGLCAAAVLLALWAIPRC